MSKRERDRLAIMAGMKRKELTLVQADWTVVCGGSGINGIGSTER